MKPRYRTHRTHRIIAASVPMPCSQAHADAAFWEVDADGHWVTDSNWNPASAPM